MAVVKVEIVDGRKVVETYFIRKLNIASKARYMEMFGRVIEEDVSDAIKAQKYNCAALASCLVDKDDNLLYPGENGHEDIYHSMDVDIYGILIAEYMEINPIESNLKAKKKKS